jgi:DNA-binding MarR family transcriptional regulator
MIDYDEYLDSPVFWLRRVYLATRKALDEVMLAHDLTGAQFEVLRHLWQEDGLEQRVLQERLGLTSPTLTGIVDGLAKQRHVERRVSAEDARVKQLFLTEQGRAIGDMIGDCFGQVHERLLAGFSTSEIALLSDWLRRMGQNMGAGGTGCDN